MEKRSYTVSEQSKHALAAALKELMEKRPIDKITIQNITDRCGMRRQNFYYHFEDIYDLMRWMFQEDAIALLNEYDGTLLWQEGLLQLFRYLEKNKAVCLCALKSVGREHLKHFFKSDIYAIIHRTLEQVADASVSADDLALMTHVYVVSFAAIIESWLLGEIERTPEELVKFIDRWLGDQISGAKMRWQSKENSGSSSIK